jgi:hypothetical protein
MVRDLHREFAKIIRATLTAAELGHPRREKLAVFSRKAADIFRAGDPAFSYEWFFGACGLDNWGELLPGKEGCDE